MGINSHYLYYTTDFVLASKMLRPRPCGLRLTYLTFKQCAITRKEIIDATASKNPRVNVEIRSRATSSQVLWTWAIARYHVWHDSCGGGVATCSYYSTDLAARSGAASRQTMLVIITFH